MLLQLFTLTLGCSWDCWTQKCALSTKLIIITFAADVQPSLHLIIVICSSVCLVVLTQTRKGCHMIKCKRKEINLLNSFFV